MSADFSRQSFTESTRPFSERTPIIGRWSSAAGGGLEVVLKVLGSKVRNLIRDDPRVLSRV
jgi:hypothetical protein